MGPDNLCASRRAGAPGTWGWAVGEPELDAVGPHDSVVLRLQELRRAAGEPSCAEIARWVGAARSARGVPDAAALPPRTTVYDAFRLGRRRLDRALVADITAVLDHAAAQLAPSPEPAPVPPVQPEAPEASPVGSSRGSRRTWRTYALFLGLGFGLNMLGIEFVDQLNLGIWLDTTGTAFAAIALGPWWGALLAVLSMAYDVWRTAGDGGGTGFTFLPVALACALVWGYGVRWARMASTTFRFMLLSALVGLSATLVAVPITLGVHGGYTDHSSSELTAASPTPCRGWWQRSWGPA